MPLLPASYLSDHLDVSLGIAVVTGQTLEFLAYELKHTSAERDAAHGVEKEVDAEVGVVEKHEELLQTP
jgi:hypothetical protein